MDIQVTHTREPGAELVERTPDGAWLTQEGKVLWVRVHSSAPAEATLSGEVLPHEVSAVEGGLETRFRVEVQTWAGRGLIYVRAGSDERRVPLDVQPHPGKLGQEVFREMLDELSRISKDLPWGLAPGAHTASRDGVSPPVVHPSVLEAELPGLLAALDRLQEEPLRWAEQRRVLERVTGTRQIDSGSIQWLVTHPRTLEAVHSSSSRKQSPESIYIERNRLRSSLNHPATRYLRYLSERLLQSLRETKDRFAKVAKGRGDGFQDPLAKARASECLKLMEHAISEIEQRLLCSLLRDVKPASPDAASLQAIIDHPVYARVQHLARRLIDPGLRLDALGIFNANLRQTWDLFELLVLYRLGGGLQKALGPKWSWTSEPLRSSDLLLGPADGCSFRASAPTGRVVELRFQQKFGAWSEKPSEFQSLSGERRPDYVLLVRDGDKPLRWMVLDAKYRASRSAIHEGLADLHIYRDALRWHGQRPCAGFILVPELEEKARRYAERAYHQAHRFGALRVKSEGWLVPVLDEVKEVLGGELQEQPGTTALGVT